MSSSISPRRGFTLIELLIVIAIIGILAAMVIVGMNDSKKKARDTRRKADLHTIQNAIEAYADKNGTYKIAGTGFCPGIVPPATCTEAAAESQGFFNASVLVPTTSEYYSDDYYKSIGKGLVDAGVLSTELFDPINKPSVHHGYMYLSADGTKYAILAMLEKPNINPTTGLDVSSTCDNTYYLAGWGMNLCLGTQND